MIVPLTLPSGSSASARTLPPALVQLGSSELFLLEIQGDLEVSADKRGQLVGHLTIDDSGKVRPSFVVIVISDGCCLLQGKPTLRIGYHLLEGTIVSLAKPLAVLQRMPTPSLSQIPPPPHPDAPDEDFSMHCGEELSALEPVPTVTAATSSSYTIRTIVRKKIVFSKRPTPIVGTSAKIGIPAPPSCG